MFPALRPAFVLLTFLTILTGLAYPLAITGISQLAFPAQAGGSILRSADGRITGSSLIAQAFTSDRYFHARPSAAGAGYDATNSGGSNLGPTSARLIAAVAARAEALGATPQRPVPIDLVTASASGLDPDISPQAAEYQVERVAAARGIAAATVRAAIAAHTVEPALGLLGEPRVNVLLLNLALDTLPTSGG